MVNATHTSYCAENRSYFFLLKKDIHKNAAEAGFNSQQLGNIDIIVAEMTSNLLKFAEKGEILMCISGEKDQEYLELICIDSGPGMSDTDRMIQDGISTSGTLGNGLGSMKRLSQYFDVYSIIGWGTIIVCRVYKNPQKTSKLKHILLRSIVVAMPGEIVSGDGLFYAQSADYFKLLVADGLGHGTEANKAIIEAGKAFKQCREKDPSEIIRYVHESIKKTRGAVGTIVICDFKSKIWKIAGVGNISTCVTNYQSVRQLMPYNGIIGHNIPNTIGINEIAIADFQQIILCSDGLKPRLNLNKYSGIHRYDLTFLAAALYKDHARKTDDMSVVICKVN
ncbi:MAG: SpoIIE family protein phosphatase [Flavobacterium sp.]|nr:SpoIIE family protein phosphatase [Pedobacter sp.]